MWGVQTEQRARNFSISSVTQNNAPSHGHATAETCRAISFFEGQEEGDLSFNEGDIITILSKDDPGWWTGSCNGHTGLFPSNFVELIPPVHHAHHTTAAAPPIPSRASEEYCVALYDFEPVEMGDLGFYVGERIKVIAKEQGDWWFGELNGKQGIFPSTYVEMEHPSSTSTQHPVESSVGRITMPAPSLAPVLHVAEHHPESEHDERPMTRPAALTFGSSTSLTNPLHSAPTSNYGYLSAETPPSLPPGRIVSDQPQVPTGRSNPPALPATPVKSSSATAALPVVPATGKVTVHGGPPPPPAPAPAPVALAPMPDTKGGGRGALLTSIQGYSKGRLKRAQTNDRSSPVLVQSKESNSPAGRGAAGQQLAGPLFAGGMPKLKSTSVPPVASAGRGVAAASVPLTASKPVAAGVQPFNSRNTSSNQPSSPSVLSRFPPATNHAPAAALPSPAPAPKPLPAVASRYSTPSPTVAPASSVQSSAFNNQGRHTPPSSSYSTPSPSTATARFVGRGAASTTTSVQTTAAKGATHYGRGSAAAPAAHASPVSQPTGRGGYVRQTTPTNPVASVAPSASPAAVPDSSFAAKLQFYKSLGGK